MSITRNNHYVAQWYQEGFFEDGKNTLAYLDLTPPQKTLNDGRVITERALFPAPTSRAFRQMDLYSTFFGTLVNDEIERRLFGDIDARGSAAVRAYIGSDVEQWMHHFQTLFEVHRHPENPHSQRSRLAAGAIPLADAKRTHARNAGHPHDALHDLGRGHP